MSTSPLDTPHNPDTHESRLARALRLLLTQQRVAALGTLGADDLPFVSMVPYAVNAEHAVLVLHISGLAAHTGNLQRQASASFMVMQTEAPGQPVHALARLTLQVQAHTLPTDHSWLASSRAAYLTRFPEAEPMTQLPDFRFVALQVLAARQIAGFGAARTVDTAELRQALHG